MGFYADALLKATEDGKFDSFKLNASHGFFEFAEDALNKTDQSQQHAKNQIPVYLRESIQHIHDRIEYLLPEKKSKIIAVSGIDTITDIGKITKFLALQYFAHTMPEELASIGVDKNGLKQKIANNGILAIDANLRQPALHKEFGFEFQTGLAEMIEKKAPLMLSLDWLSKGKFGFIGAGRAAHSIPHIFKSNALKQLFNNVRADFQTTIVCTPPVIQHADVLPMLQYIDGIVLVCSKNRTQKEDVIRTKEIFDQREAKLIGVVLVS